MTQTAHGDLRLEVAFVDDPNPIENHSGVVNTAGWEVLTPGTVLSAVNSTMRGAYRGRGLSAARADGGLVGFASPRFDVAPGQWVGYEALVGVGNTNTTQFTIMHAVTFFNASGGIIANTGDTSSSTATWDEVRRPPGEPFVGHRLYPWGQAPYGALQAPAGAVHAQLRFWNAAVPIVSGTRFLQVSRVRALISDDPATARSAAFYDPELEPLDLLTDSFHIEVTRGLDARPPAFSLRGGTINVSIKGTAGDPSQTPHLRRGIPIRLSRLDGGVWREIFTGAIDRGATEYRGRVPVTTVTAHDLAVPLNELDSAVSIDAPTTAETLYWLFLYERVPYMVPGTFTPTPNGGALYAAYTEQGKMLDRINELTRSRGATAWIDRRNVLQIRDLAALTPLAPTDTNGRTFSDTGTPGHVEYTDLDPQFVSDDFINSLIVARKNYRDRDGRREFGPYTEPASIAEWGTVADSLEINGGEPRAVAARALSMFGHPRRAARTLTFALSSGGPNAARAVHDIDIHDHVRVINTEADLDQTSQVVTIRHTITPKAWRIAYTLAPPFPASTDTPASPGGDPLAGPTPIASPIPSGSGVRTSDQTIPSGTATALIWQSAEAHSDLEYVSGQRAWRIGRRGRYLVIFNAAFRPNSSGTRRVHITVNGVIRARTNKDPAGSGPMTVTSSRILPLEPGDLLRGEVQQNTGSPLGIVGVADPMTTFDVAYLGGL